MKARGKAVASLHEDKPEPQHDALRCTASLGDPIPFSAIDTTMKYRCSYICSIHSSYGKYQLAQLVGEHI